MLRVVLSYWIGNLQLKGGDKVLLKIVEFIFYFIVCTSVIAIFLIYIFGLLLILYEIRKAERKAKERERKHDYD